MEKRFKNDCYNTYVLLMDRSFAYIFCQGQNLTLYTFRINNLKNIFFSYLITNLDPKENICKKWSKNESTEFPSLCVLLCSVYTVQCTMYI